MNSPKSVSRATNQRWQPKKVKSWTHRKCRACRAGGGRGAGAGSPGSPGFLQRPPSLSRSLPGVSRCLQVSPGVSRCLLGMTCYRRHLSGRLLCFLWVWVSSRPWCLDQSRSPSFWVSSIYLLMSVFRIGLLKCPCCTSKHPTFAAVLRWSRMAC